MNQHEFKTKLEQLLTHSLSSATFEEVKPVAEALLYSEFLPTAVSQLNALETRRLVFLLEKFSRYSCSSVFRRTQLKAYSTNLSERFSPSSLLQNTIATDPLAKKLGLDEDLNHLKPELLSLQTRHHQQSFT
ncbi:hypothetical protein [Acinetobacter sp. CFCC 10889]|uniref:hypothetical protein n=1 Tax=Acinetobacter sp. CFCC 10889 TaxID=1775557 RepID=UPI000DD05F85|nr:hypothetical protein [Acinetobacter sp. CFCC 10889]